MKKIILFTLATVSLIIAIVAIFLPLIPTTPFLLLSSYLYLKSSRKAYDWLINSKYLGQYIKNYKENKGIPIKVKIFTLLLLWLSILSTATFFVHNKLLKLILIFIALGISIHILKIKTYYK